MRTFSIVERIGNLGIAQYLDNKKYTLVDLESGRLANKEFRLIKYSCEFPFEANDNVDYADYYDLSKFEFIDEDGHYTTNGLGDFILNDEMYDQVYTEMVKLGADRALKHMNFKNFEPGSTRMSIIKAAVNSYLDGVKRIAMNVQELDEKVADYIMGYEEVAIEAVVRDKQKEYAKYAFDMIGDEIELDSDEHDMSKPVNIIDMAFDDDITALYKREAQM